MWSCTEMLLQLFLLCIMLLWQKKTDSVFLSMNIKWFFPTIVHLSACFGCTCKHAGVFLLCTMYEFYFLAHVHILMLMLEADLEHKWALRGLGANSLKLYDTLNEPTCTETVRRWQWGIKRSAPAMTPALLLQWQSSTFVFVQPGVDGLLSGS